MYSPLSWRIVARTPPLIKWESEFLDVMTNWIEDNTQAGYMVGWRAFCEYLHEPGSHGTGQLMDEWNPLTDSPRLDDFYFTGFLCWLRSHRAVTFDTARKYLCGVRAVLISHGLQCDLTQLPVLMAYKRAWKRKEAKGRTGLRLKESLTIRQIEDIIANPKVPNMVKAAVFLGFHTLARISELVKLRWEHVTESPDSVRIFLPSSKTDPFRRGSALTCLPSIWARFLSILGATGDSGFIFPGLTRTLVAKFIGPTHSMRRGGAQYLFDLGFSLETIQRRGRWASMAWRNYIDTAARDLRL